MNNLFERVSAVFVTIILLPLFIGISGTIIVFYRYSPFFFAKRIGKNGKTFVCLKFQAMRPSKNRDDYTSHATDEERITSFGAFLRDHGWDELPQLFNIILGQMSFVGPRPIPMVEYEMLKKRYPKKSIEIENWKKKRLSVLPGLSGWHQVHLPDHNIVKLDMEYLANSNLKKRIEIIVKSFLLLIFGKERFFNVKFPIAYPYSLD